MAQFDYIVYVEDLIAAIGKTDPLLRLSEMHHKLTDGHFATNPSREGVKIYTISAEIVCTITEVHQSIQYTPNHWKILRLEIKFGEIQIEMLPVPDKEIIYCFIWKDGENRLNLGLEGLVDGLKAIIDLLAKRA